eukprot:2048611-Lingulodinium_polyedra.AAC.1
MLYARAVVRKQKHGAYRVVGNIACPRELCWSNVLFRELMHLPGSEASPRSLESVLSQAKANRACLICGVRTA